MNKSDLNQTVKNFKKVLSGVTDLEYLSWNLTRFIDDINWVRSNIYVPLTKAFSDYEETQEITNITEEQREILEKNISAIKQILRDIDHINHLFKINGQQLSDYYSDLSEIGEFLIDLLYGGKKE